MRTVIVEDSRLARNELRDMLTEHPHIELVGEAADGDAALVLIETERPELVFLDIHLPGMDGFGVLEKINYAPQVIFTTAFDEYAIKSFEYNALDYLLKPLRADRLAMALKKVSATSVDPRQQQNVPPLTRVFVKDGDRCWFVTLAEVRLIESVGNYARLYFGGHRPLLLKSLNALEENLDSTRFFRVNRAQVVNLDFIKSVEPLLGGRLRITLHPGEEVEVSRRQATTLREQFGI